MKFPAIRFERPRGTLLALYITGVVAIAAIVAGSLLYVHAKSDNDALYSKLTAMTSDDHSAHATLSTVTAARDSLQANADEVASRESAVAAETAALKTREDAVKAREDKATAAEAGLKASQFGDGTFQVGRDIVAGTYQNSGGGQCYWARLSGGGGGLGDIIANDNTTGPTTVTIGDSDWGFKSSRCGTWTKVG